MATSTTTQKSLFDPRGKSLTTPRNPVKTKRRLTAARQRDSLFAMDPVSTIRAHAKKLGLTTTASIAGYAGVPRKTLDSVLREGRPPSLATAVQIFRVFGIRPERWVATNSRRNRDANH